MRTKAAQTMNDFNIEILLGHVLPGNNSSYYKVIEEELREDYLRAVPLLTINESKDITALKQQQETLEKKQDEKDKEIELLRQMLQENKKEVASMVTQVDKMTQKLADVYAILATLRPSESGRLATTLVNRALLEKDKEEQENQST